MAVANEMRTLSDGRRVDVLLGGDPAGTPLVMHHGTPSDATAWAGWSEPCAARGLRLIAMSRPGYASSDRDGGRPVAAAAADAAQVLDQLGADRFLTLGWSGGGPHALACAALLGARCRGAAILAGVGPWRMDGVDFLAGMGPENLAEFGAAEAGETAVESWLQANGAAFRTVTGAELADAFGGLVPPIDQDELRGRVGDDLAAVMRRALAGGFAGWVDDDLAFVQPWGFALDSVAVPVTLWQGDLDLMVPPTHGQFLARAIPGARLEFARGHGHISLLTRFRDAILDDLIGHRAA